MDIRQPLLPTAPISRYCEQCTLARHHSWQHLEATSSGRRTAATGLAGLSHPSLPISLHASTGDPATVFLEAFSAHGPLHPLVCQAWWARHTAASFPENQAFIGLSVYTVNPFYCKTQHIPRKGMKQLSESPVCTLTRHPKVFTPQGLDTPEMLPSCPHRNHNPDVVSLSLSYE